MRVSRSALAGAMTVALPRGDDRFVAMVMLGPVLAMALMLIGGQALRPDFRGIAVMVDRVAAVSVPGRVAAPQMRRAAPGLPTVTVPAAIRPLSTGLAAPIQVVPDEAEANRRAGIPQAAPAVGNDEDALAPPVARIFAGVAPEVATGRVASPWRGAIAATAPHVETAAPSPIPALRRALGGVATLDGAAIRVPSPVLPRVPDIAAPAQSIATRATPSRMLDSQPPNFAPIEAPSAGGRLAVLMPPRLPRTEAPSPPLRLMRPLVGEGDQGGVCRADGSLAAWRGAAARVRVVTPAPGVGYGRAVAAAALQQTKSFVVYSARYQRMAYPMGDLPPLLGACSDVIIRAYRALGVDLQALVQTQRVGSGDRNIDHRRTETLRRLFARGGASRPVTEFPEDYWPGDIVTYYRPFSRVSRAHIAIVSEIIGPSGRPLIIHNRGWGPQLEDALFVDKITGHYRYQPVSDVGAVAGGLAERRSVARGGEVGPVVGGPAVGGPAVGSLSAVKPASFRPWRAGAVVRR